MSYGEFWKRYLRAHAKPETRAMHYCGSTLAIWCVIGAAALHQPFLLIGAPVAGYGFAWVAHYGIEHNRPETFGHPFWSLVSDYRMFLLFCAGRLGPHLAAAGM